MDYLDWNDYDYLSHRSVKPIGREKSVNALTEIFITNEKDFHKFCKIANNFPNKQNFKKQKVNAKYNIELYDLFCDHGYDEALRIAKELNTISKIWEYQDMEIRINKNSDAFYRDSNYSFSLVKDGCEILILSFFPKKWKLLEVTQIQGKKSENISRDYFDIMIEFLKLFALQLWFEGIQILRWDKNYHYRAPWDFSWTEREFQVHQWNMKKIYNWYPHRYRGFSKPWEWYSQLSLHKTLESS